MDSDYDFYWLIILCAILLVPAAIVLVILRMQQVRRGKFHRQRITKKSSRPPGAKTS
jgi:hypothetical protein